MIEETRIAVRTTRSCLPPAPLPPTRSQLAAALAQRISIVGAVLTGRGADPASIIPLIRALRATVHGFLHLEPRGGLGLADDIDNSFTTDIDLVIDAIATHAATVSAV